MKSEILRIQNALIPCGGGDMRYSLRLLSGARYGIFCDRKDAHLALTALFRGQGRLTGEGFWFDGHPVKSPELQKALRRFTAVIEPESHLLPVLSIAENICLSSKLPKRRYRSVFREETQRLFDRFDIRIDPDRRVTALDEGERVLVELLAAHMTGRRLIVLSQMSAILTEQQLSAVRTLVEQLNEMTFILIDSPNDPAFGVCEAIQILRGSVDHGAFPVSMLKPRNVYNFYSEDSFETLFMRPDQDEASAGGQVAFEFRGVSTEVLTDISFSAYRGEIFKILCMDPQSLRSMTAVLKGEAAPASGEILAEGQPLRVRFSHQLRRQRICFCAERACDSMVIPDLTVRENILIDLSVKTGVPLLRRDHRRSVDDAIRRVFGEGYASRCAGELSAYDRQRLVYLKIYLEAPKVAIFERPFYAADARMREMTLEAFRRLTERGMAVILLITTFESLNWVEGDSLCLINGAAAEEEEVYAYLFHG